MIRVGIAGVGFMGMIHYLAYQKVRGVKVAAIWSRDKKKLAGDWHSIKGNFGPAGKKQMQLGDIACYNSLDKMLADDRLHLIDVCLPTHLHAMVTIKALKAGKHVFCEKPIALTTADAARMVKTAQNRRRLLLIGHVLPFMPEFSFAYQTTVSRRYGKLLGGHFRRTISDPTWMKGYYDLARFGGPLLDLHVHDAHFIRLLGGMPDSVSSTGRTRGKVVEYFSSQFHYAKKGLTLTADGGVIHQQGRAFTHAFELHLERATLLFDFAMLGGKPRLTMPVTVLDHRGRVTHPKLGSGDPVDAFAAEIREVVSSLRNGKQSPILSGQLARDAVVLCHKQTQSVNTGRMARIGN